MFWFTPGILVATMLPDATMVYSINAIDNFVVPIPTAFDAIYLLTAQYDALYRSHSYSRLLLVVGSISATLVGFHKLAVNCHADGLACRQLTGLVAALS